MNDPFQDDALARQMLRHVPDPAPGANTRVAHRLRRSRAAGQPPIVRSGLAVAGLAAAAAGLLSMFFPMDEAAFSDPQLASDQVWQTVQADGVALSFRGTGTVQGERRSPRIEWQRGTLNVEVTPEHGVDLRVQTREAEVRVLGTGFSVHRDVLGTHVEVRHGIVETRCGDGPPVRLLAGDSADCLPRSAAGLLGRARALAESGANPDTTLATISMGAALADPGGPVAGELAVAKVETLATAGRTAEALAAVEMALAAGAGVRQGELVSLAVHLAERLGGCALAAPWLAGPAQAAGLHCGPPAQIPT